MFLNLFFVLITILNQSQLIPVNASDCMGYYYTIDEWEDVYNTVSAQSCSVFFTCCGSCTNRTCCVVWGWYEPLDQSLCSNNVYTTSKPTVLKTTRNYSIGFNYSAIIFTIIGTTLFLFCIIFLYVALKHRHLLTRVTAEQSRRQSAANAPPSYEVAISTPRNINIESYKDGNVSYTVDKDELPPYPGK